MDYQNTLFAGNSAVIYIRQGEAVMRGIEEMRGAVMPIYSATSAWPLMPEEISLF